MCGIAGIISSIPGKFGRKDVQQMSDCLQHRGPDGNAIWQSEDEIALLAHNRLAIIDLSDAAAQPMHYLQRYTIVHNGEVYNYKELKAQLFSLGYTFHSQSDTEVILAAYDYWKENCLQHFEGMFAFAIWDAKERCLFAARDRFGEKPFYFVADYSTPTLWFASELKSFYQSGFEKKDYNGNLLLQYLATGVSYNADAFQTFHKHIQKLPARHYLTFYPYSDTGVFNIQPYFDIDKSNRNNYTIPQATAHFKELFFASVSRRLRSDVETGTSLSGGIDSAGVVAAIHQLKNHATVQKAFTASFPSFEKDETEAAAVIARQFGLQHFYTSPSSANLVNDLEKFLSQHDEPVSSSSVYAQYKVYELAKLQRVKVVLDGQGADEILAGYSKYFKWYLQELYRYGSPPAFHQAITAMGASNDLLFGFRNKLAARFPAWAAVQLEKRALKKQRHQPLLKRDFVSAYIDAHSIYKPVIRTLNDILYADVFGGNLEELLRNADRNAMAHGIEVRLPFLDYRLVEFIFSLPANFKLANGYTKYLLRLSMDPLLPKQIVWNTGKTGFEPPQQQWMKDRMLQDKIHEAKKTLIKEKILDKSALDKPVQPKAAHEADNYDWRYLSAAALF